MKNTLNRDKNLVKNTRFSHWVGMRNISDYSPFGVLLPERTSSTAFYRYGFNGKESINEVSGEGNSYDFGARMYNPRIGVWLSVDPMEKKYTQFSPYVFTANNPILYYEIDGAVFDLGNLSESQKVEYAQMLEVLNSSKLFKYYYEVLQSSEVIYTIKVEDLGVGGRFNPMTNTVTFKSLCSPSIIAQELFHAYQNDLGVYYQKDHTVIETEGDLMTQYVANEAGIPMGGMLSEQSSEGGWAEDISVINGDKFTNPTNEQIQSEEYDAKFSEAVDFRIEHFKTLGENYKGYYSTPNSGQKPLATKEVFKKTSEEK